MIATSLGRKPQWNVRKVSDLDFENPQAKRSRCDPIDTKLDIKLQVLDPFLEVDQIIDEIINETKRKEQEEENRIKAEELLDFVYSNHLIAEKIFENLPFQDILTCARVRRSWYPNARYVLTKTRRSFVNLRCQGSYSVIQVFNRLFSNCVISPFNGLSVSCSVFNCARNLELILPRDLKLKYLHLNFATSYSVKNCDSVKAVKKWFNQFSSTLQELHIEGMPTNITSLVDLGVPKYLPSHEPTLQKFPLPKLWKLTLPSCSERYCGHVEPALINDLLSSCNVQELDGGILPKFIPAILEQKKLHLVKSFQFRVRSKEDLDACSDFVDSKHSVESLILSNTVMGWTRDLMLRFSQNIDLLLNSNASKVKEIEIDPYTLFIFTDARSPQLPAVKHLRLNLDLKDDFTFTYSMLRTINFSKFPNVTSVTLTADTYRFSTHSHSFLEISSRRFLLGVGKVCPTVTTLKVIGNYPALPTNILPRMASVFPNVRHLHIDNNAARDPTYAFKTPDKNGGGFPELLGTLWNLWTKLETLKLTGVQDENICVNLDSAFTGIPSDTCTKLLETKDYSKFEDFQSSLSIRNLTNLKSLQIQIDHKFDLYYGDLNSPRTPELFLSEVSGICGFAQMPDLKVEISRKKCDFMGKRCCFLHLNSLSSYVTLTEENSKFSLDL